MTFGISGLTSKGTLTSASTVSHREAKERRNKRGEEQQRDYEEQKEDSTGDGVCASGGWEGGTGGAVCYSWQCQYLMASAQHDGFIHNDFGISGISQREQACSQFVNFYSYGGGGVIIIIYPLTARVVGAPRMISQPVSYIFPCSPLPSRTRGTPGLSIP